MKKGFTLVELAIVVTVVGLLVGGVLVGRDIIFQANVRSVVSQLNTYQTAVNAFKLEYGNSELPGDFDKATTYGLDKDQDGNVNTAASYGGNGDGDSNGYLAGGSEYTSKYWKHEVVNFWVHLSNSDLIKEKFAQINNCDANCNLDVGVAYPELAVGNGMVVVSTNTEALTLGSPDTIGINYDEFFLIGTHTEMINGYLSFGETGPSVEAETVGEFLTPEEAYSLDSKIDDGLPDSGNTIVYAYKAYQPIYENTFDETDCFTNRGEPYNLAVDEKVCLLAVKADWN